MRNDKEFNKVVDLLTPKYPRECTFSFGKKKIDLKKIIFAVSSIAAMIAIVLTMSLKPFSKVSASEILQESINNLSNAESLRVDFTFLGVKTSKEGVYKFDLNGNRIKGTMYLLRKEGKQYTRIDWHDKECNTIIYKDGNYFHIKKGIKVEEREAGFPDEIIDLISLKHLPKDIIDECEIESKGNLIIMKCCKNIFTFKGIFQRDTEKLISADVTVNSLHTPPVTALEANNIVTNIKIPEDLFSE